VIAPLQCNGSGGGHETCPQVTHKIAISAPDFDTKDSNGLTLQHFTLEFSDTVSAKIRLEQLGLNSLAYHLLYYRAKLF